MVNVLIVDDDKHVRYLLREVLELTHYNVFEAKSGEAALEVFERERSKLVSTTVNGNYTFSAI